MKALLKALGLIVLFGVLYIVIMVLAMDYCYPYPNYYLDVVERDDQALNYRVVTFEDLDKDTSLYFSRSSNGAGGNMHVGTIDCGLPRLIRNFFCKGTSSVYYPINSYGYLIATDAEETCILFGSTSDENTVAVTISFYDYAKDSYYDYEMVYDHQNFYYVGFDPYYVNCESRIFGYNEEGGITFEYSGKTLNDGIISRDTRS